MERGVLEDLEVSGKTILWSIIAFCGPSNVSKDFVLMVTTFSSFLGQFY